LKNSRLQVRLFCTFAVAFLIPIIIFAGANVVNMSSLLREKFELYEKEVTNNALIQVDALFVSLEEASRSSNTEEYNRIINTSDTKIAEEGRLKVESALNQMCVNMKDVVSVYVYTCAAGKFCAGKAGEIDNTYDALQTEWFQRMANVVGSRPELLEEQSDLQNRDRPKIIPFVCPIRKYNEQATVKDGNIGVMQINLTAAVFDDCFSSYIAEGREIYLLKDDGTMIYSSTRRLPEISEDHWAAMRRNTLGRYRQKSDQEQKMVSYKASGYSGVRLIMINDRLDYIGETKNYAIMTVLFLIVLISLFLMIAAFISRRISRPIQRLSGILSDVQEGRICEPIVIESAENNRYMDDHMNKLIETINELLSRIQKGYNEEQQQEYAILEAQINPHFLYNTLDAVRWFSLMRSETETADLIKSIINLLRSSIQIGQRTIPIERELDQIRDYLELQKLRYIDSFQVFYDVDEKVLQYATLKFVLQPIIENAIFHGIDHRKNNGKIDIRIWEENGNVIYKVRDNGKGMDLQEVSQNYGKNRMHKGIGTENVNQRIKQYFGEEYGLRITSALGKGTEVEIIIPAIEWKVQDESVNS